MKSLFLFLLVIGVISCQNEQEKIIEAELAKVQSAWKIQSYEIKGSVPDSLKNILKTGELLFKKCNYSRKAKKSETRKCTGDFFFNEEFYSGDYIYDTNAKNYKLSVYILTQYPQTSSKITPQQAKVMALMNGTWTFNVTDKTMTAVQLKNDVLPDVKISFTAVEK